MFGDERGIRELLLFGELKLRGFSSARCALCESEMYPFEEMYLYGDEEACAWVCGNCLKDKIRETDAAVLAGMLGIDRCAAGDIG